MDAAILRGVHGRNVNAYANMIEDDDIVYDEILGLACQKIKEDERTTMAQLWKMS